MHVEDKEHNDVHVVANCEHDVIVCEACGEIAWNTTDSQSSVEHLGYEVG